MAPVHLRLRVNVALPQLATVGPDLARRRRQRAPVWPNEVLEDRDESSAPVLRAVRAEPVTAGRAARMVVRPPRDGPRHTREAGRRAAGVGAELAPDVKEAREAGRVVDVERRRRAIGVSRQPCPKRRRAEQLRANVAEDVKRQHEVQRTPAPETRDAVELLADAVGLAHPQRTARRRVIRRDRDIIVGRRH